MKRRDRFQVDAVPVVEQVRHVEELRRSHQLGRLPFIAPQLGDAPFYRVRVLRVLVFDDGHRDAVDHEHYIGAVAFSGRRLEPPLPCHVQGVRGTGPS